MSVAVLLMVKNEAKSIMKTLNSLKNFPEIKEIFILDTGSTDSTLELIKDYKVFKQDFVDFSTSRNYLIKEAKKETKCTHFLYIDANDELQGSFSSLDQDFYKVKQIWKCGTEYHTYYNVKIFSVKSDAKYIGAVHEYLEIKNQAYIMDSLHVFQSRNEFCENSGKRWEKDAILLEKEYVTNKTPRSVFYLAQTYLCLCKKDKAMAMFKERTTMGGYDEEIFWSFQNIGMLSKDVMTSLDYYNKAFNLLPRAEPLARMAEIFMKKDWHFLAQKTAEKILSLSKENFFLFLIDNDWEYIPNHILGISCFYTKDYKLGMASCMRAIELRHRKLDISNLKWYTKINKNI